MTTLALAPRSRHRQRSFRLGIILGLGLPVTALLALTVFSGNDTATTGPAADLAAERTAFTTFEESLAPIIEHGAATVVYGMRPGINDIYDRSLDDETLAGMAEGWVDATQQIRADFAALEVPAFLTDTADLYRQSFDAYHATARALLDAVRAPDDARVERIQQAAGHGTRADQLYNTATAQLDEHRERLSRAGETPTG